MRVSSLKIGDLLLPNNILLAPMAGYTDYAFRSLQLKAGMGFCFTELVSAKGLYYGGKGSKELLFCGNDTASTAVQIFGCDPYYMRAAAQSVDLAPFKVIDINMGCPVPKVFTNGEGSALLKDVLLAEKIIAECVKSGKIITVKIRTGLKRGDDVAEEFAKAAQNAGASMVTVHGRVREDYYSGEPDYGAIERAVNAVSIPVIANGGVFTVSDANDIIERTGAAGVMLARGAVKNPFLVCDILGVKPPFTKREYVERQLQLMASSKGEIRAVKEFRKFAPYYFKGGEQEKRLRIKIVSANTMQELTEIFDEYAQVI